MTVRREYLSDLSLSQRLERTEALSNARFVDARARLFPGSGAEWMEVAGTYAMYDGADSPCTQTFCLGLFALPGESEMNQIESFFGERGVPVFHEVSPLADKAVPDLLGRRGYRPVELTNLMYLPLAGRATPELPDEDAVRVRIPGPEERDLWARTGAEGWRESVDIAALLFDLMRISASVEGNVPFLADLDGCPIAAGLLAVHNGVALLSGASTIPEWRKRGAQRALFEARLQYAAAAGCELAMVGAEPGSASARNAERRGFRVAYTRIKWGLTSG